jgi:hypothetical protein
MRATRYLATIVGLALVVMRAAGAFGITVGTGTP